MAKSNVVEFAGRDKIVDPLTDLLRTGAEQLLYQAVEEELAEMLARHSERRLCDGRAGVVRNGYLPAREVQTGVGPVTVKIPKVRAKTGEAGDVPLGVGAAVCEEDEDAGSGVAVVVFEGDLEWRDGSGAGSVGGAAGEGIVSQYGIAIETSLGARVPELERGTIGQRPLGLCVGGRSVRWASSGTHEAVCVGGDRSE